MLLLDLWRFGVCVRVRVVLLRRLFLAGFGGAAEEEEEEEEEVWSSSLLRVSGSTSGSEPESDSVLFGAVDSGGGEILRIFFFPRLTLRDADVDADAEDFPFLFLLLLLLPLLLDMDVDVSPSLSDPLPHSLQLHFPFHRHPVPSFSRHRPASSDAAPIAAHPVGR